MAAVAARGGMITRREALAVVARHVVDDAVQAGVLVPLHPGVYGAPELVADPLMRLRAAACYAGGAVSHLDALRLHRLLPPAAYFHRPPSDPIHVAVPEHCHASRRPGLAVHRERDFELRPPWTRELSGIPVVAIESAVVCSFPLLPASERRFPVIQALRERRRRRGGCSEPSLVTPVSRAAPSSLMSSS
jgi:hypothetical protein